MDKILIVGGTRGLGLSLTEYFKQDAYDVISVGTESMDVTQPDIVHEFCKLTCPDTVIYLAVKNLNGFIHKLKVEDVKQSLDVNLLGLVNVLSSSLPYMRVYEYGRFIYISSVLSRYDVLGTGLYAASKAFGERLIEIAAKENANKGITCNTLRLGYFDVGLMNEFSSEQRAATIAKIPLKRLGTVNELYKTIIMCIHNEYINGATIDITGGL